MSVVSHASTKQQREFYSVRVAYSRMRRSTSPAIKELYKVILALALYLATMIAFVALGVWMWIPPSH